MRSNTPASYPNCVCNGRTNRVGEGGADCQSISEGRQWCYVAMTACADSTKSSVIEGTGWSYDVCTGTRAHT